MASTYSNLKIQLMAAGENSTTWGNVTNLNLGTAIEEAIVGSADVTFSSNNQTLSLTNTNASQTARNMRLRCTGTTGGTSRNLVVPSIEKPYIVQNDCADSIVVKTASGSGVTVPAGASKWVYSDGVNVVEVVTALSLTTPLPTSSGGTGSNSTTYCNLTTNVTGTLPVANGGTGQNTYTNGQLLIGNSTGNTLTKATLTAGTGISITNGTGSITIAATGGTGTVTNVAASGGTTGLTFTGSPITTNGTFTLGGTLVVANGGTGQTSYTDGQLLIGNSVGNTLSKATLTAGSGIQITNGNGSITIAATAGGGGTVTSVDANTTIGGLAFSGGPIATSGTLTLALSDAATFLTAVGAAASGANTDITALDQDVTVTATGTIAANTIGYRGLPQSTNTTLALSDAGKHIYTASNVTIPANGTTAFPVGTTIVIANSGGSTLTISINTDTLRRAGTTSTGTRTLAAYGLATLVKVTSTVWFISGNIT